MVRSYLIDTLLDGRKHDVDGTYNTFLRIVMRMWNELVDDSSLITLTTERRRQLMQLKLTLVE
jgi:hypothetical protein